LTFDQKQCYIKKMNSLSNVGHVRKEANLLFLEVF